MTTDVKSLPVIHLLLLSVTCSTGYAQIVEPVDEERRDQNVSVQASNKSAANSPVKPSEPGGPARMVLAVPDEPTRGRKPVLRDELGAVVNIHRLPPERLHQNVRRSSTNQSDKSDKRAPRYTREQIAQALRKYAREPSAAKVVALAVQNAGVNPDEAKQMASRARAAGWLPVAKLAVRRGLAQDLAEYQTIETDRTSLSTDDDLSLEASLTFEFDRLVFDRNEVSIAREERSRQQARTELIRTVVTLYYERRRLQLERDLERVSDISHELRIVEIEAMLNSFTKGAFGSMISDNH